jgi:hypothetical protein
VQEGLPLVYLHGIDVGRYLASAAMLVDDDPAGLTFMAVLADLDTARSGTDIGDLNDRERRVSDPAGSSTASPAVISGAGPQRVQEVLRALPATPP